MNAQKDVGIFKLNSVDIELQQGECSVFTNFIPGYPALTRNGVNDLYATTANPNVFNYEMLYIPPSLGVKAPNGEIHIFAMTVKKETQRNYFALECWNVDTNSRYCVFQGEYNDSVRFSFIKIHDSIYVVADYQMLKNNTSLLSKNYTNSLKNKIVEWDSNNELYVPREMHIDQLAKLVNIVCLDTLSPGLTVGKWVEYTATYVKRFANDGTFDLNGTPDVVTTFAPPQLQSLESSTFRKTLELTGITTYCDVKITLPLQSELDIATEMGATHIRLWRTDHADAEVLAQGASKRFLVDLPIFGINFETTYIDSISDAALEGELNILSAFNYTEPPLGRFSAYAGNKFWIGGTTINGRWYNSETPGGDGAQQGAVYPQYYSSLYKVNNYYVDFEPSNLEKDTGCVVFRRDLFFFKEKSIGVLYNGDTTRAPHVISNTMGCTLPNTLILASVPRVGLAILFMSNDGPAIIDANYNVNLLEDFKVEELWPGGELINYLNDNPNDWSFRDRIFGFYHDNSYYVTWGDVNDDSNSFDGNRMFSYSFTNRKIGAFKVDFDN